MPPIMPMCPSLSSAAMAVDRVSQPCHALWHSVTSMDVHYAWAFDFASLSHSKEDPAKVPAADAAAAAASVPHTPRAGAQKFEFQAEVRANWQPVQFSSRLNITRTM